MANLKVTALTLAKDCRKQEGFGHNKQFKYSDLNIIHMEFKQAKMRAPMKLNYTLHGTQRTSITGLVLNSIQLTQYTRHAATAPTHSNDVNHGVFLNYNFSKEQCMLPEDDRMIET